MSFTEFLVTLKALKPRYGEHIIDRNGVTYRNCNPVSYTYVDPAEAGWAARDAFADEHADATEPQLQQAYTQGAAAAERTNRDAARAEPNWRILKRDSPNDSRGEDSLLQFTDSQHRIVDYYAVIANLRRFGENLGYTLAHYRHCLQRFVGFFNPSLRPVVNELDANELARFLMRMSAPVPKAELLIQNINSLIRQPGDHIRIIVAQLQGLLSALYANHAEDEKKLQINRLMMQGLISFTTGMTQKSLLAIVESAQMSGKVLEPTVLIDSIIMSEKAHGAPTIPLQFKNPGMSH
jgi:hypothetical protein